MPSLERSSTTLALALAAATCACRASPRAWPAPSDYIKVEFNAPRSIQLRYARADTISGAATVENVLELGGRLYQTRGDTVHLIVFYVTTQTDGGTRRDATAATDRPLTTIVIGSGTRVSPSSASESRSFHILQTTTMVVIIALLLPLVVALAHHGVP